MTEQLPDSTPRVTAVQLWEKYFLKFAYSVYSRHIYRHTSLLILKWHFKSLLVYSLLLPEGWMECRDTEIKWTRARQQEGLKPVSLCKVGGHITKTKIVTVEMEGNKNNLRLKYKSKGLGTKWEEKWRTRNTSGIPASDWSRQAGNDATH